ncbi:30S ribosomal protein S6 [Desulfobulbus rhabdoformis]|uniref:30S ribosomal protein S6 n=1 Tax=Desulfobulbus rhabdoformis TaxID=34032 RepID=UPI001963A4F6|nr:30S ribosomal protein S6 [Desulfobulbus rhabdoformis]MBM9613608.1 30S ribosomal protein S6 [Desulfobulbus rhabdoformis]
MRHYETTYILRPNLGEDQFTEIIDRTNAIITDDAGSVITLDRWGMKRLAYEIKKEVQGYYVYLNYAATAQAVDEIERIFRIDDRVLRYLTIKLADAMDAEAIEAEKQRIAEKAAASEQAAAEAEEGDDSENKSDDDNNDE